MVVVDQRKTWTICELEILQKYGANTSPIDLQKLIPNHTVCGIAQKLIHDKIRKTHLYKIHNGKKNAIHKLN
jgi:hypothetical protein